MLFNSVKLRGIAPKIQKLAKREGKISNVTKEIEQPVVRHSRPTQVPRTVSLGDEGPQEVQVEAVPTFVTGASAFPLSAII